MTAAGWAFTAPERAAVTGFATEATVDRVTEAVTDSGVVIADANSNANRWSWSLPAGVPVTVRETEHQGQAVAEVVTDFGSRRSQASR
jgi:hypothetical protein